MKALQGKPHWDNYGRPRPIPDITKLCADYRYDLVSVRGSLGMLCRTQERLDQIIRTVNSYEEDDWGIADEPEERGKP